MTLRAAFGRRSARHLVAALALAAAAACHSERTTAPVSNAGDGGVTMTVDGVFWRSSKASDHVTLSNFILELTTVGSSGGSHALILVLSGVRAPGTFSLNSGSPGDAVISDPTGGWGTAFAGGTGTATITALDATRVAGTFSFDAKPASGAATGTVSVRSGTFDIPY